MLSCGKLSLMFISITVGYGTLYHGLYKVSLNHEFSQSLIALHLDVGSNVGELMKNLQSCGIDDGAYLQGMN